MSTSELVQTVLKYVSGISAMYVDDSCLYLASNDCYIPDNVFEIVGECGLFLQKVTPSQGIFLARHAMRVY